MSVWLPPYRKDVPREETTNGVTPSTYGHHRMRLNEIDPSDPTVQALAPRDAEERLPPLPAVTRGFR